MSTGQLLITTALPLLLGFAGRLVVKAQRLERRLHSLAGPAHELRGAVSALGLGLVLLEREPSLRRLAARLDALRAQLGRADAAIDELDRARGVPATNGAERRPQLVDLASLVGRRARAWSQLAPAYGARLRLSWRAGPTTLLGDRSRLEQAIDNLIGNALEHGGRRVLVEGARRGAAIRISIWDSGAGPGRLPAEVADAPASSARGHGLALARAAIEWHGGHLSCVRRDGGAAVEIELPVEVGGKGFPAPRARGVRADRRIGSTAARAA